MRTRPSAAQFVSWCARAAGLSACDPAQGGEIFVGRPTFTKNRSRLLEHEVADRFFAEGVAQAKLRRYLSSEHFSVDGTLLEAWASHKSFKPKDQPPRVRRTRRRCRARTSSPTSRREAVEQDARVDH